MAKGSDKAGATFVDRQNKDGRYVSAYEGVWCIFEITLYYRIPSVERLPFHVHDMQYVPFNDQDYMQDI